MMHFSHSSEAFYRIQWLNRERLQRRAKRVECWMDWDQTQPPLFLARRWYRVLFTKWMLRTDEQLCQWTVFSLCFESESKILLKQTYCYLLIHYPFKPFILQFFCCYRPRRWNPKPKRRLKHQRMFLSTPRKRKRQIPTRKDLTVTRKNRENLPRPLYRILWTY